MKAYVWYMTKPEDERRYCSTTPPSPERRKVMEADGYIFFRIAFELPPEFDPSVELTGVEAASD